MARQLMTLELCRIETAYVIGKKTALIVVILGATQKALVSVTVETFPFSFFFF